MPSKPSIPRICEQCGAAFLGTPTEVKKGRARYCGYPCARAAQRRAVPRGCEWCGAEFTPKPASVAKGEGRFCSRSCRSRARKTPLADRFWKHVDRSGGSDACWPWTAGRTEHGYGKTGDRVLGINHNLKAHRVAWMLTNGPIPKGAHVMHRCDTPPCCNPAHLRLGTHTENMRDMWKKGRGRSPFIAYAEVSGN